ncbi:MAG: SPOR domain-containing protein [Gammaproteobacteria bacterium]|nr:SPOR domain-containing protein [Gammaproteobacteria bacterium]
MKQRLIGALVLVSLVAIVIPFLIGNEEDRAPGPVAAIPPPPSVTAPELATQTFPGQGDPDAGGVPADAQVTPDTVVDALTPPPAPEPAPSAAPAQPAEVKPAEPPKKAEPKTAKVSETAPKPQPAAPSPGEPVAWVVQLGSFASEQNALALRDRLRAKGYPAFVERVSEGGATAIRVRIGPETLRSKADALQQKIEQEMKVKGVVMRYR